MWLTLSLAAALTTAQPPTGDQVVGVSRLPAGCVQPSALVGPDGSLRVVCLTGDPKNSDVVLLRRGPAQPRFDPPEAVSTIPGAAIAMGTIRGPQITRGIRGRIHVIWNGSTNAGDALAVTGPLIYTRSDPATRAFAPERDVLGETTVLDGGAAIVSDGKGLVIIAWHAGPPGDPTDETHRNIFVRRSTDDGETFEPTVRLLRERGVCACCSLAIAPASEGKFFVFYRRAQTLTDRDMTMALADPYPASGPRSLTHLELIGPWPVRSCPMTSCDFAAAGGKTFAAWESQGQVYAAELRPDATTWEPRRPASGSGENRKHPRLALNTRGEMIMAWTEGTAWNKGGSVAWQTYTPAGEPIEGGGGRSDGLPPWGFAIPVAQPGQRFEVVY